MTKGPYLAPGTQHCYIPVLLGAGLVDQLVLERRLVDQHGRALARLDQRRARLRVSAVHDLRPAAWGGEGRGGEG
jgi:hypothetical protein